MHMTSFIFDWYWILENDDDGLWLGLTHQRTILTVIHDRIWHQIAIIVVQGREGGAVSLDYLI